jgi:hypothetical protein
MWPPKRWEIESGHIRISSWVQGERRRRRSIIIIIIIIIVNIIIVNIIIVNIIIVNIIIVNMFIIHYYHDQHYYYTYPNPSLASQRKRLIAERWYCTSQNGVHRNKVEMQIAKVLH